MRDIFWFLSREAASAFFYAEILLIVGSILENPPVFRGTLPQFQAFLNTQKKKSLEMIFMAELNGFLPVVEIASDEGKKKYKKGLQNPCFDKRIILSFTLLSAELP